MKPVQVTYTRRFNHGNYEHSEYTVEAILDESGDDSVPECLVELKKMVAEAHAQEDLGSPATTTDKEAKGKGGKADKNKDKEEKGKAGKGKAQTKPADPEPEEEVEEEVEEEAEEEEGQEVEEEVEEETEEEPPKGKTGKSPGGKFKAKGTVYSRTNDTHKKLFSDKLTELIGKGWSKNEQTAAKALAVSKKLEGTEFLDAEGEILDSFIAAIKKGVK